MEDSVQFANIAAPAVVEANLNGADLVFLTGGLNRLVQSLVVRPEIERMEQLRGRTLGVGEPGDIEDRLVGYLLARQGLKMDEEVMRARITSQPDSLAQMDRGEIDGALFSPPYVFKALKHGHRQLIGPDDHRFEYQLGGLISRRSLVERDPDLTERMVRAYVRGVHHFKAHPEIAAPLYRKYSEIEDPDVARQCYENANSFFRRVPYPTLKGLQTILDQLGERIPAARTSSPEHHVDLRWVRQLEESGFIQQLYDKTPVAV
jgi:ABC-type nitrate/sulfonate/bicarbonate transport system substrate-binding protein